MQTVKRRQILELFLRFIVDCSYKDSMHLAKWKGRKESFESESNQPSSRVNRDVPLPPLCPQGSACVLRDEQDVSGISDGCCSIA